MHRYGSYVSTPPRQLPGGPVRNFPLPSNILSNYTRATLIGLGAIGCVVSALMIAKVPALHRFGTTVGWVFLPPSALLFFSALVLRVDPPVSELIENEDVGALIRLLNLEDHIADLGELCLKYILSVAARKDSVKLAEKVLSRDETKGYDNLRWSEEPFCVPALELATKSRSLNVLSYLLEHISKSPRMKRYFGTLVSGVQKAFEKRDRELAALLAQKLDSPARTELFGFICNHIQNDEVCLQIAMDLISGEAIAENAPAYFTDMNEAFRRCGFQANWILVEYLLDNGAPPLNTGIGVWPAEMLEKYFEKLCESGVLHSSNLVYPYYQLLENLLEYAAKHNYLSQPDSKGDTPLHLAVRRLDKLCVKAFIQAGADIAARNCAGKTPFEEAIDSENTDLLLSFILPLSDGAVQEGIMLAIERGKEKAGIFLLRSGREFALSDLLALSLQKGMTDLSTWLSFKLNGAEIDDQIVESAQKGGLDTFFSSLFYQKDGKHFAETFTSAAEHGNAAALQQAFRVGIQPHSQGVSRYGELVYMALLHGHSDVVKALKANRKSALESGLFWTCQEGTSRATDIVKELLLQGAEPEVYLHSYAPIHWAVMKGNLGAIQALCKHDPSLLTLQTSGNDCLTPLRLAVKLQKTNALCKLIACGADVNQVDEKGGTLLHTIARGKSYKSIKEKALFLELLIQAGTSTFAVNADHLRFSDYLNDGELKAFNKHYPCKRTACSIITGLPLEIRKGISENLSAKNLTHMSLVSKEWYASVAPILDPLRFAHEIKALSAKSHEPYHTISLSPRVRVVVPVDFCKLTSTQEEPLSSTQEERLSKRLLKVASSKLSFNPQIGKERKVRYICALIEAGADPKFRGEENTYFWQMLSAEELDECKAAFKKRRWEESWG